MAHDTLGNPAIQTPEQAQSNLLILRPTPQADGSRSGKLFIGYDAPYTPAPSSILSTLEGTEPALPEELTRRNGDLLTTALRIETPDAELDRALAWPVLALDQAWFAIPHWVAAKSPATGRHDPVAAHSMTGFSAATDWSRRTR